MKKNVFSKAIAVLASTAVLGAASMMSASAAGATISADNVTGKPGETVKVTISVDSANLDSVDALVSYDGVTGSAATLMSGVSGDSAVGDGQTSLAVFSGSALPSGAIATIDFTIPEDAEAGTTYPIAISLNTVGQADPAEDITADSSSVAGSITVEAEDVIPSDTPTETQPDTQVVTTTAEATTTAAGTTTAAKKATAAAASTGSPKTGTAGVAVAVAGLVTAGAAAVVLKKRH